LTGANAPKKVNLRKVVKGFGLHLAGVNVAVATG
jgi:hypothetical protein